MSYTKRTLWIHLGLFLLAFLAFILPVVVGTAALLPLWLSGGVSIILAAGALIDAVGTGTYRIGNFLLSVGCVLNLFIIAISVLDIRRLARQ